MVAKLEKILQRNSKSSLTDVCVESWENSDQI